MSDDAYKAGMGSALLGDSPDEARLHSEEFEDSWAFMMGYYDMRDGR